MTDECARARAVLLALAPPGLSLGPAMLDGLERAYASPPRAYHSLTHVAEVAKHFADIARDVGWKAPHEVYLAVLFHDAIYEPGAKDNEAKSAALARSSGAGLAVDVDRVARLIELTARHGALAPGDVDAEAALFLDCDMAILGADAATFATYEAAIRLEYAAVPDDLYRAGRGAFLRRLAEAPRIFLSPYFHERLDAPARANVRAALAALTARACE